MYRILFTKSAEKELFKLSNQEIERILKKIKSLSTNPKPSDAIKLKGKIDLWRIRSGKYRIVYSIIKKNLIIEIVRIRHRKESYRNL
ncbi:MAG: type II toxin-antitoxin system RelE/ParE family toxin [Bacteroidales bacterium]|nr:type II toxin-antitoxin system RelE/ParE family toxin [Bacteroidales bacterium]MCF8343077.1 type II toxin-antitoxin system RelE/ParE family toxin [Bacteroidales bacterium]MCF8349972.1 type II toxin-antitoxin system RelE/ParE family toxin [Bacteroidales bacterium]MCF8376714.1 type II toxin-antitoxin system RelE/ParE family toxin [Bacteroidales bacterium]